MKKLTCAWGELWNGDVIDCLKKMKAKSVQLVVTSPPYYGLRKYRSGSNREIGQEETPQAYVDKMVEVFAETRRVLRDDGVMILNLGDSYGEGKQLLGIPWRVALALQSDGWILRSDIPWVKRSCMMESCKDRPAKALEYIFMFAKTETYYWDWFASRIKGKGAFSRITKNNKSGSYGQAIAAGRKPSGNGVPGKVTFTETNRNMRNSDLWLQSIESPFGLISSEDEIFGIDVVHGEGLKEKHFAAFPTKLVNPFILSGTSAKGCCPKCGKCLARKTEKVRVPTRPGKNSKLIGNASQYEESPYQEHSGSVVGNRDPLRHVTETKTTGWKPGCECDAGKPVPCVVMDIFSGSGTSGIVSVRLKRRFVGIELAGEKAKHNYFEMSRRRIQDAYAKRGLALE